MGTCVLMQHVAPLAGPKMAMEENAIPVQRSTGGPSQPSTLVTTLLGQSTLGMAFRGAAHAGWSIAVLPPGLRARLAAVFRVQTAVAGSTFPQGLSLLGVKEALWKNTSPSLLVPLVLIVLLGVMLQCGCWFFLEQRTSQRATQIMPPAERMFATAAPSRRVNDAATGAQQQHSMQALHMIPSRSVSAPSMPSHYKVPTSSPGLHSPDGHPQTAPSSPRADVTRRPSFGGSGMSLPPRWNEEEHRLLSMTSIPHLCTELVVPEETECNLIVPELAVRGCPPNERISINDTSGVPVFHASFTFPEKSPHGACIGQRGGAKRLILWSAIDGLVFAFCRDAEPELGGLGALTIFHHSETPFGVLRTDQSGDRSAYSIMMYTGREILFYKPTQASGWRAEDESGRLLAMVTDLKPRSVRIGPQVDAGFITLAMLGIDLLEHDFAAGLA